MQNFTRKTPSRTLRYSVIGLLGGVSMTTLGHGAALAQSEPQEAAKVLDVVVVEGWRDRTALAEERAEIGVVDIVTLGDIALNSQTSIADLAKLLPGISVGRDQGRNQSATGEAQFVTIRGFDAGFNGYTLDGLRLPQTAGSSRAISLNLFSPFTIGSVVADKTPGARQDSDAIAGIVDLRTPTAFDFDDDFVRARVLGQASDRALDQDQDGLGYAAGLDMARRFGADDRFGVYAAAYYENRDTAAESVAVQNSYRTTRANVGTARDNSENLSADGIQWNFFNSAVERYGASASLDYAGTSLELYTRLNYAMYNNTNTMNQGSLRNETTSGQSRPEGGNYGSDGIYRPYGINPAGYFRAEDVEQELFTIQTGGKYRWDSFYAAAGISYADGRLDQPTRIEAAFRGEAYIGTPNNRGVATEGVTIDLGDPKWPVPVLSNGAKTYVESLDRPNQIYIQQGYDYLSEDKATFQGNFGWDGEGMLRNLEVGAMHETSDRSGRSLSPDDTRYRFRTSLQSGSIDGVSFAQFPGENLSSFMGHSLVRPMKLLSREALEAQVKQYVGTVSVSQERINQGLSSGSEERTALYATATLGFGDVEIIPGLRYEDNSFSAKYYLDDADGARFVEAGRDYDHLAPSLLAAWRPSDRVVVRAAVRSSYARPDYNQIAGPTRISRDPLTNEILRITQPNPDLEPVEAVSYDLGLELYGNDGQYLQLALYHKDLDNVVVPTATRTLGSTIDGIEYFRPANGRSGSATGLELSGSTTFAGIENLPFLANFGAAGSLTYQDTEVSYQLSNTEIRTSSLPQAPDVIYNAELFYRNGPLRANLWYNRTGRILATVQDSQPDIYVQAAGELNLGLAYQLNELTELGFSARNLLDEHAYWATVGKSKRYISNDRNGGYLETGRVFQVSVTMKY